MLCYPECLVALCICEWVADVGSKAATGSVTGLLFDLKPCLSDADADLSRPPATPPSPQPPLPGPQPPLPRLTHQHNCTMLPVSAMQERGRGRGHGREFGQTTAQCRKMTLRRCLTTTGSDTTMNALGPKASLYTPPLSRNLRQATAWSLNMEYCKSQQSMPQKMYNGMMGVTSQSLLLLCSFASLYE